MQRKLRRKFILLSMASLFIVLLMLFGGINIANYFVTTQMQDNMLHSIAENNNRFQMEPHKSPAERPPSPETKSMTRYFVVELNTDGSISDISLDNVSSVTSEDAENYSQKVQSRGHTSGYCGEYRYYVYEKGESTFQLFLNCSSQLQFMRILLLLSLLITLLCFAILFCLVFLLSKQAISPYVKNMELQKQFITDAGHELKTPLTSISTSADILALELENNEWVTNIQNQTSRLSKLVGDLVAMSRLDEEMALPEKMDFSLSEALWETLEPFLSIAQVNGKSLEYHIDEGLNLHGDIISIQQMLSILLDNAIKYSNDHGQIHLKAYRKRQKPVIEVFNTCDAIDTKNLDRLFERFYRADPSRSSKTGGTGVGLSIAKAIAQAHGGTITVKSPDGKSIVFTVTL